MISLCLSFREIFSSDSYALPLFLKQQSRVNLVWRSSCSHVYWLLIVYNSTQIVTCFMWHHHLENVKEERNSYCVGIQGDSSLYVEPKVPTVGYQALSLPTHRKPVYKANSLYIDVILMMFLVYVGSDTVALLCKVIIFLWLNAAATIVLAVCFCADTV